MAFLGKINKTLKLNIKLCSPAEWSPIQFSPCSPRQKRIYLLIISKAKRKLCSLFNLQFAWTQDTRKIDQQLTTGNDTEAFSSSAGKIWFVV